MINEDIKTEILARLQWAEPEHDIRILFTIESGSRALGYPSPNSDYDVRFVYAHRHEWYQAVDLEERRDVVEYDIVDEIDLNGWDVQKSLRLFWKSNPGLVEWIQSPIVYIDRGPFRARSVSVLPLVYSPVKSIYHYRSMAKTNYRAYLNAPIVPLKKYFYVLRPLLAARWLIRTGAAALIEFEKLLTILESEPEFVIAIHELLQRQPNAPELGKAEAVPLLNQFIEAELNASPTVASKKPSSLEIVALLNAMF